MSGNKRWLKLSLIAFGIAIAAILVIVKIANSGDPRSEESRNGVVVVLGAALPLMLVLGVIGVIIAIIRFATRLLKAVETSPPDAKIAPGPRGFPMDVNSDGPGQYRIEGVHRQTKLDLSKYIQADSAANAKVKAELDDIVVTSVVKVPR
jgi:hypothetical protein